MTDARAIVERYFGAFWGGDTHTARRCLADDLSFSGPGAAFTSADAYRRASEHARRVVKGVEKRKVFADGPDVGTFYSVLMEGPVGSAAVAEWHRVDGGKISSIRTILDTAPFTAGARQQTRRQPGEESGEESGERACETALDPVCNMTVEKASAASTRDYEGTTYYFCTPGCAAAFDRNPPSGT